MQIPTKSELIELQPYLTKSQLEEIDKLANEIEIPLWYPNPDHEDGSPNPQRLAYESEADILGYGGSAGSGKTDLLLGVAATQQTNSVIFRRVFPNHRGNIERSREIFNPTGVPHGKNSFNEQFHRWKLASGKQVEFEACQHEKDKNNQRGRPRDFYGFDEATEFTRSQFDFIIGWNRSTDPNQRCRIILTFNPPTDEVGSWVVDFFLPWISYLFPKDFEHPRPARPGELRWYATVEGQETECTDGTPFERDGLLVKPLSRTFIPGKLKDNPHLINTNYEAILQSLPEPLRSQVLHGDFAAAKERDPWQVIPVEWVKLAQKRWLEMERPAVPISGTGVDVARGGQDKTTKCDRYDNYFDEVKVWPGVATPDGPTVAALVEGELEGEPAYINIDVIGVGSSAYDSLKPMYKRVNPINAGERSDYRDRSGKYKMRNVRAEYYWRMREALDPDHGEDPALPPGNEVVADLCSARYKVTTAGIQIESKEEIKERIGRSPDVGEAILLANYPGEPQGIFFG